MIGKMKMRLLIISGQKRKIKNLEQRKVENILVYNFWKIILCRIIKMRSLGLEPTTNHRGQQKINQCLGYDFLLISKFIFFITHIVYAVYDLFQSIGCS